MSEKAEGKEQDSISYTFTTELPVTISWQTVPARTNAKGQNGRAKHLEFLVEKLKGADWSKSSYALSVEYDLQPATINRVRKHLGQTQFDLAAPYRALDWTKQDIQLCEETGISQVTIRKWRVRLGKAQSPDYWKHRRSPAATKYESLDWTKHDADLARENGVTRERVRQWRLELGKPKVESHNRQKFQKFKERLSEFLDEDGRLIGRKVMEVMHISGQSVSVWRKKLGLQPHPGGINSVYPWKQVDWRLPTKTISEIWNIPFMNVRARRWNYHLPLAQWRINGKITTEQQAIIDAQKQLAQTK